MAKDDFLKLLQQTAKEQSALQQQKWVPDFLSDVANFAALHLWQVLLGLAIMSALLWNL